MRIIALSLLIASALGCGTTEVITQTSSSFTADAAETTLPIPPVVDQGNSIEGVAETVEDFSPLTADSGNSIKRETPNLLLQQLLGDWVECSPFNNLAKSMKTVYTFLDGKHIKTLRLMYVDQNCEEVWTEAHAAEQAPGNAAAAAYAMPIKGDVYYGASDGKFEIEKLGKAGVGDYSLHNDILLIQNLCAFDASKPEQDCQMQLTRAKE